MLAENMPLSRLRELGSQTADWTGTLGVGLLPRLGALLHSSADRDAELAVALRFGLQPDGQVVIAGSLSGELGLVCQRCLGELRWAVPVAFELTVVASESELAACADPFDVIVAGDSGLTLLAVIEDELLAALPLAPLHADGEACAVAPWQSAAGSSVDNNRSASGVAIKSNRPFAGLDALLQSGAGRAESNDS